jgi:hypothetical protein
MNNTDWTINDERILREWIDESTSYKWMHERSFKMFWWLNLFFMLPIILLSTLTGTANFTLEKINDNYRMYIAMLIGTINILAAAISTVYQFLKIAELKENYNITYKNFDKFNRTLKLELLKRPHERNNKKEFMEIARKEYDRLIESSPDVPMLIIVRFRNKFKKVKNLIMPDIVSNIQSYNNQDNPELADISLQDHQRKDFIDKFIDKYGREPTEDEILEHINIFFYNV